MREKSLILGTRGSALALAQMEQVRALLHRAWPRMEIEVKIIKTMGDKRMTAALARSGTKGLFTKELEEALIRRKIDVAIHSLKDVPTELPAGLVLAGVPKREDPRDVLVYHPDTDGEIPKVVFTSSPRRSFQVKRLWAKCETREIRGNVETRLQKLADGKAGDALLLAMAGLRRLDFIRDGIEKGKLALEPKMPFRRLTIEEMVPAPGQAAIALEGRADDGEILEKLKVANHIQSYAAVLAERSFLRGMGGGCAEPMAAYARAELDGLRLVARVERRDGSCWCGEMIKPAREAEILGRMLAEECLK